ncbi:SRPBCC family protein [Calycomorphotria hydatis]|nr:SRPBCC domain-containing protein [Calycomorphotria hydatis]
MPADNADERTIVITREFNAPRQLVWDAFTKPEHIPGWWGPEGFSTRVEEYNFEVGGRSKYVMTGPDGTEYPVGGTFLSIDPPESFSSTDEFEEGFEVPEGVDLPEGMVTTAIFEDLGTTTRLILKIEHPTVEDRRKHEEMGVVGGWNSSFDCLDKYLESLAS